MLSVTYHEISFPGLGLSLNPSRGLELGPLSIRWYAVIIALGLALAVVYACRRSKQFGLKEDDILDGVLCVTPFAIICARVYYCIFKWEEVYSHNPISCLYIWEGGIAIYGGIIGAALGVLVFCKIKKIKTGAVLDLVALGFLIGQAMGRWGNFINREAFGGETEFFLRMGLTDRYGNTIYVHPTFLYESLWNALGFMLLHFMSKRRTYDGQTALQYVAWYGAGRALIEGMRTDSLYIPGTALRVSQVLSVAALVVALVILIILHFRKQDPEKLFVNQVAAKEAAAKEAEEEAKRQAEAGQYVDTETVPLEEAAPEALNLAPEEAPEDITDAPQKAPEKKSLWKSFQSWLRS